MGEQFGRYIEALATQVIDCVGNIGRIPVDDGSDDEVQGGCPELLGSCRAKLAVHSFAAQIPKRVFVT
jgi:hypothetical protein